MAVCVLVTDIRQPKLGLRLAIKTCEKQTKNKKRTNYMKAKCKRSTASSTDTSDDWTCATVAKQ
jgi:hypothetical protein